MIKLSDGELLDLLPSQLKNDTDMICLSHALKIMAGNLLNLMLQTMTQNFIDLLPEKVLDVLAVELRSLYYSQDMEIEVKRRIIKNTLIWHTKAGTPDAVAEMVSVLFREGKIIEWYDFDEGEKIPGTFDIVTRALMTEDITEVFMKVIERVKNERSHLRRVLIERTYEVTPSVGVAAYFIPHIVISNNPKEYPDDFIAASGRDGVGMISTPKIVITNNASAREQSPKIKAHHGAGSVVSAHVTITNHPQKKKKKKAEARTTTGAVSYPRTTITNKEVNQDGRI